MSEHTGPISSLSLLLVQTKVTRWKAAAPEQLTGTHLYLVIAKSGYLFHGHSNGMHHSDDHILWEHTALLGHNQLMYILNVINP